MISAGSISWLYLFIGVLSAAFVSLSSYRYKLIGEKSELLYLSFGFYRNFLKIFFRNFFSSVKLIIALAFRREPFKAGIHVLNFKYNPNLNLALLATSINMQTGLFCVSLRPNQVFVHAVDKEHLARFNFQKLVSELTYVNDDHLV